MEFEKYVKEIGLPTSHAIYYQYNFKKYFNIVTKYLEEKGILLMSIDEALKEYPEFKKYFNNLIEKNVKNLFPKIDGGYFLYVPKNTNVDFPIEACFIVNQSSQHIHNLVIVEKNSCLRMYTGCVGENRGAHLAISEIFVKKGAKLENVMIHKWDINFNVKPFTRILVEKNGFVNNIYINLTGKGYLKMLPKVFLKESAKLVSQSIVCLESGEYEVGTETYLQGKKASSELTSKIVVKNGKIKSLLRIVAEIDNTKGYSRCDGLVIKNGVIEAIPELISKRADVDLSHEAAIGKISEDVLYYLMSKGLDEEQARSLYIREFLTKDLPDLDERIMLAIKSHISKIKEL